MVTRLGGAIIKTNPTHNRSRPQGIIEIKIKRQFQRCFHFHTTKPINIFQGDFFETRSHSITTNRKRSEHSQKTRTINKSSINSVPAALEKQEVTFVTLFILLVHRLHLHLPCWSLACENKGPTTTFCHPTLQREAV